MTIDPDCPTCEGDGWLWDEGWCGDEDHCSPANPCPTCNPEGLDP